MDKNSIIEDFKYLSPTEFSYKHPYIKVCDANGNPCNHPGYNLRIDQISNTKPDIRGQIEIGEYYTPSIEDFYVGYKYELYTPSSDIKYKKYNYPFGNIDIIKIYLDQIEEGWLRTKYLDKEDIESLGWLYTTSNNSFMGYMKTINKELRYTLEYNTKEHTLIIQRLDDKIHTTTVTKIFIGFCKSINELKKIISYLNIK